MSKVKNLIHIVFATKHRELAIPTAHKRNLYAFLFGILKKRNCWCYRINGVADHVHLLVDLHPAVALASLVKEIKQTSSIWLKNNPDFPNFKAWNEGYFACSVSESQIGDCINYIMNQEEHHKQINLLEETRVLCTESRLNWHEGDWE